MLWKRMRVWACPWESRLTSETRPAASAQEVACPSWVLNSQGERTGDVTDWETQEMIQDRQEEEGEADSTENEELVEA